MNCSWSGGVSNGNVLIDVCSVPFTGWDLTLRPYTDHVGFSPSHHFNSPKTGNECA